MKKIETLKYPIYFGEKGYEYLANFVSEKNYSKLFVLVDSNTNEYCLTSFLQMFPFEVEVIEIQEGEPSKTIETCVGVWQTLSELGADRKSLLLNLGGGMVTDLGGFVASTFMRGIDFINIPTSLLAMVDASVGGKTGVDLGSIKNQIGVINTPQLIVIDTHFLQTLPQNELCSGLAEMFKHGLIASEKYLDKMLNLSSLSFSDLEDLVLGSVEIKNEIVTKDPTEKKLRKTLNFGHTLGHAIESFCLENKNRDRLLHGEAIVIGMILALFFSVELQGFSKEKMIEIMYFFRKYYQLQNFTKQEIEQIIHLLKFDKKNSHGNVNFVLLKAVGNPVLDCTISNSLIFSAFEYYQTN